MSMDMGASVEPVSDEAAAPEPSYVVSGEIAIRLSDSSQAEAVDAALRAVDSSLAPNVAYTVSDDGPARRGARADAIAAARADADAYAAAMNMRVVRIVRVTERIGMDIMSMLIGNPALAQLMEQVAQPDGPDQVVRAFVGIDFALAPR
jgi:uncharacterized protein YggE